MMRGAEKNARFGAATPMRADSGCALMHALNLMRIYFTISCAWESSRR